MRPRGPVGAAERPRRLSVPIPRTLSGRLRVAPLFMGILLGTLAWSATSVASVSRAGSEPAEPPDPEHAGVETQARAFLDHYILTLEAGDEDAIRALFVADDRFAWFTDGARSYASPEDVLAGMKRFNALRFETTLSDVRIVPLGAALASARSSFRTHIEIPGSEDQAFGGCITWLLEKDSVSGQWRVLLGHTSTPGQPPTATGDPR